LGTNTFPTVVLPVPLPCLPFGPTIGLQQKQKEQNKNKTNIKKKRQGQHGTFTRGTIGLKGLEFES
jgi:hypothetical protein